ncbi:MAG: GNAT family N-acetyltransferase [Acidothermaceae bacterium]
MSIEIVQGALVIRSWHESDAEAMSLAISESVEHLRPFMPWIADEPKSVEQRRELIAEFTKAEADDGDLVVGVFLDGRVVGGSGLHRRLGPGGLEIGYWVHRDFTRRGIASSVSRALTDHAFARPDIDRVEIHHDVANMASEGVPRALGFRHVGDEAREIKAPAETGVHRIWRITRPEWTAARST